MMMPEATAAATFAQVEDDVVIWHNKRYRADPRLNDAEPAIASEAAAATSARVRRPPADSHGGEGTPADEIFRGQYQHLIHIFRP